MQNNPNAFALSEHQKLEGAQALHMEETRVKMMMAIGQIPPLDEAGMLQHLHEHALEVSTHPEGARCELVGRAAAVPYTATWVRLCSASSTGRCVLPCSAPMSSACSKCCAVLCMQCSKVDALGEGLDIGYPQAGPCQICVAA